MRMKMVIFKILTLFLVTTAAFETTPPTTDQSQRVKLDIDAINVTCIHDAYQDKGCLVNLGLFGARQVVISYKNLTTNEGEITLHVDGEYSPKREKAQIDVSSAIKVDETTYEVTEMVDIKPGSWKVYLTVLQYTKHDQIDIDDDDDDDDDDFNYYPVNIHNRRTSSRETNSLQVISISFIPKKLNSEKPYRIISTSQPLLLIEKTWYYSLENKVVLMRYNNNCQYTEQFHFERNAKGEYRIYKGLTKGSSEGKYLEVRDKSVKIGNEVVLVDYPGNKDNAWSLLPGRPDGEVKIQSKLTGTCISAIHGFGSDLVLVDCKKGQDNNWSLKFCDG